MSDTNHPASACRRDGDGDADRGGDRMDLVRQPPSADTRGVRCAWPASLAAPRHAAALYEAAAAVAGRTLRPARLLPEDVEGLLSGRPPDPADTLRARRPALAAERTPEADLAAPDALHWLSPRVVGWRCARCGCLWRDSVARRVLGSACPRPACIAALGTTRGALLLREALRYALALPEDARIGGDPVPGVARPPRGRRLAVDVGGDVRVPCAPAGPPVAWCPDAWLRPGAHGVVRDTLVVFETPSTVPLSDAVCARLCGAGAVVVRVWAPDVRPRRAPTVATDVGRTHPHDHPHHHPDHHPHHHPDPHDNLHDELHEGYDYEYDCGDSDGEDHAMGYDTGGSAAYLPPARFADVRADDPVHDPLELALRVLGAARTAGAFDAARRPPETPASAEAWRRVLRTVRPPGLAAPSLDALRPIVFATPAAGLAPAMLPARSGAAPPCRDDHYETDIERLLAQVE